MYFNEPFEVKGIVITQPSVYDIVQLGENKFYAALSPFLYNPTTIRLYLWKIGIDWNKVKDIETFALLISTVNREPLKLVFRDVSFDDFRLCRLKPEQEGEEGKLGLYSQSQDILLDEDDYMLIAEYLRELMGFHPKQEKAKGKTAKRWIIDEDEMKLQHRLLEDEDGSSLIDPISTCLCYSGFKYNKEELKSVNLYEFMYDVQRIQKIESSTAALRGCYSGFVDVSKMDKETLNFMGAI